MNRAQWRSLVSGLLFIVLGVIFLLEALEVFELPPATLWPLLIVALGIGILAGSGGNDNRTSPG